MTSSSILQFCPNCRKLIEATYVLTFSDNRQLIADRSSCPCGQLLWDWCWSRGKPFVYRETGQMRLFE